MVFVKLFASWVLLRAARRARQKRKALADVQRARDLRIAEVVKAIVGNLCICNLAFPGFVHLAFGIWHLTFGIWHLCICAFVHLAFGIWHLAFGICVQE